MISFSYMSEILDQLHTTVEDLLFKTVGHMPHSEIMRRCQKISHVNVPFVDRYYLDEKLLFETEIKFTGNKFIWEIRRPGEAQDAS